MREDRIGFVTGAVAALALVGWMAAGAAAYEDAKPAEAKAACCAKDAKCCAGHAEGSAQSCCDDTDGQDGKACHRDGKACCESHAATDGEACCPHGTDGAAGCGACCGHDEAGKEAR